MPPSEVRGRCLCGRVSYAMKGHLGIFQYCHCSRCRKFTGSAFAANLLVAPADFRWSSGEEFVGRYELEDAKHFATAFCRHCGSALPWLGKSGKAVVVPAGTLDDDPGIKPYQNIFWGSRAGWYAEPNALPAYEELPPKPRSSARGSRWAVTPRGRPASEKASSPCQSSNTAPANSPT